jgi:hypothetical protein
MRVSLQAIAFGNDQFVRWTSERYLQLSPMLGELLLEKRVSDRSPEVSIAINILDSYGQPAV